MSSWFEFTDEKSTQYITKAFQKGICSGGTIARMNFIPDNIKAFKVFVIDRSNKDKILYSIKSRCES